MKSILLTTSALVAFAGAAAAEVSFSGDATLGYNDFDAQNIATATVIDTDWAGTASGTASGADTIDDEVGFYWDADVAVTMTEELDNGITAGVAFNFEAADLNNGQGLSGSDFVLSLTSDSAGLYVGDTAFAAETRWVSAGDMEADGFSEADGETALRADVEVAMVAASISMVLADTNGNTASSVSSEDYDQLSFGAAADVGQFSVAAAYQEESTLGTTGNGDYNVSEIWGLSVGTTVSGADIRVAYASNETAGTSSTGIKVSYPFGSAVTATAYYVDEAGGTDTDPNYGVKVAYAAGDISATLDFQDDQGTTKTAIDASYDIGNGFTALAGYYVQDNEDGTDYDDEFYVAGTYDLGGGASLLASYAGGADNNDDEIGAGDYKRGTTVEVNFSF
ncbi:porin [Yoonia maritima]|uniref:porin n=1 Tax=Yoonia maritima TaxID=1435347 RepID=UPI0037368A14